MKKLILILSLGLSLSALDLCKIAQDSYKKNNKYFELAFERKHIRDMQYRARTALRSLEDIIVECEGSPSEVKQAQTRRHQLMSIIKKLKG